MSPASSSGGQEPQPPGSGDDPIGWHDAFLAECLSLDPSFRDRADTIDQTRGVASDADARLLALNRAALAQGHSALCLSGGGIRSASFAVGVLQGLARCGGLERFDYLSTVSGGGFTGAWLSAWLHRAKTEPASDPAHIAESTVTREALRQLSGGWGQPGAVEPWPLSRLRNYTRYLSPRAGMFSADFWALIATMLRNLLLNWLVLLPLLAVAMLVPRIQYALIHLLEQEPGGASTFLPSLKLATLIAANVAYAVAVAYIVANLPSYGDRRGVQRQFLLWCLVPLCLGTMALTYYWAMGEQLQIAAPRLVWISAIAHLAIWFVVGLVTGHRRYRPRTWMAALAAGAFGAFMWTLIVSRLFENPDLSKVYVATAFPLVLGSVLLQAIVFVGLAGREVTAADLEWWSRAGAWILIAALGWFGACLVDFGGPALVRLAMAWSPYAVHELSAMTALFGGITSWVARPSPNQGQPSAVRRIALALMLPTFVLLVVVAMASINEEVLRRLARAGDPSRFASSLQSWPICPPAQEEQYIEHRCHPADSGLVETMMLLTAFLGIGLVMNRLVPVNKFSLHSMYHHRVTRAFLGASRVVRRPNPFTGFDSDDDLELSRLAGQRPLHVVNATLNTRTDSQLGRQERRALSFTFSPLHTGNSALGYRPSSAFAYNPLRRQGITLGTAVTISGAAASPAMGEFTTPSLAFVLTLLNARLGVWLGNPGASGRSTWRRTDPTAGIGPIVRELLGLTTDVNPYVYLSDGGHFDNLGLWEMVQRRCRYIVVVDAGCDPDYTFTDLATALRQVRLDQGVRIDLPPITIGGASDGQQPHFVAGTIHYDDVGGTGTFIYIKPALTGDEPVDVLNYRKSHPTFPHESTAEQWFSEAQFESYRILGLHSVEVALADRSENGLGAMIQQLGASALMRGTASAL